jgi:hypothetical protein
MKKDKIYTLVSFSIIFILLLAAPLVGYQKDNSKSGISLNALTPVPVGSRTEKARLCLATVQDAFLLTDTHLTDDNCDDPGWISLMHHQASSAALPACAVHADRPSIAPPSGA